MYDNNAIEGILFAIFASAAVGGIIISSTSLGFDEGAKKGRDDGIIFCMEKPKECKIKYDYLKLQENQK
jgi:hypothetical protein